MRVLVACEYSGVTRRAFQALGHTVWSADFEPAEDGSEWHYQGDCFDLILNMGFDLMIAHPPCTYLCRAGYHWCNKPDSEPGAKVLKGNPRRAAMRDATTFFMALLNAPIERIAIENPRPIVHAGLPKPTQSIQPWQHGHGETKETCLWLKNLPPIVPTNIVEGRKAVVHKMPPSKTRWKDRSRTYPGIAKAWATQWGGFL